MSLSYKLKNPHVNGSMPLTFNWQLANRKCFVWSQQLTAAETDILSPSLWGTVVIITVVFLLPLIIYFAWVGRVISVSLLSINQTLPTPDPDRMCSYSFQHSQGRVGKWHPSLRSKAGFSWATWQSPGPGKSPSADTNSACDRCSVTDSEESSSCTRAVPSAWLEHKPRDWSEPDLQLDSTGTGRNTYFNRWFVSMARRKREYWSPKATKQDH